MKTITLKANAKVNIHLAVGLRRADGYHTLNTLFQEISWCDALRLQKTSDSISVHSRHKQMPLGPDNIIVKALMLLRSKLKIAHGMRVDLVKRIPMGAGLGGGSSDAAAALWGGWRLWTGRSINKKRVPPILKACAKKLGADVSFFLSGGRAWGRGIGDQLSPVKKYRKEWMVLIYPRVHVSTKNAYGWLDQARSPSPLKGEGRGEGDHNDFESVVLPRFPAIRRAKEELIRRGCRRVMMSGSGSTVFGMVKDKRDGLRVKHALKRRPWDVFVARTV